jgi:predicted Ser/Thr protein kinase
MRLSAGTKFGPYEILAPIGAGGLGEVYRARDSRLNRDVALKILPADFAADPVRLRRFEQEARAVAALNHPNIVAVYDVGENFLVTELVEGQTLRATGKISQRQAVDLAVQIAQGIAAAHAAGITHRDLKPHNIMVSRDGRAKILDFGLAKIAPAQEPGADGSEVSTQTQEGMLVGTVGYMSPEQLKGLPADQRSDIFSFGLVLYEMLAGTRAFAGGSTMDVFSAILKEDPPELPESVAPWLKRLVGHCIEKNPARRFQSALDLAFTLQSPQPSGIQAAPAYLSRSRGRALTLAAAIAIAAISILASRLLSPGPLPVTWSGVMLGGPEMAMSSRLSPDGHLLAFSAMVDGLTQIAIMKPESANWTILTHDRTRGQGGGASWSPDGTLIYYNRSNGVARGVYSVPVLGGDEHLVLDNAGGAEALPDGSLIVTRADAERRRSLHRFWPGTGRVQQLAFRSGVTASENTAARANPDGKTALIWGQPMAQTKTAVGFYAFDITSGSMKRLSPSELNAAALTAFAVTADGKSVIAAINSGALTRIVSFPLMGSASELPLFTVTSAVWYLDAGPDGSVYASMFDRPSDLIRFATDGTQVERLASFPLVPEDADIIAVLPDGRAVVAVRASGQNRLMVVQKGKDPAVLVNTTEETMAPLATCGPDEVAFMIGPAPHETIALTEPESGRIVSRISPGKGPVASVACSPDGATLYFSARGVIWSLASSGGEARRVRAGDHVVADPSGRRLVVQVIENSQSHLFSVPLDGGQESEIHPDPNIRLTFSTLSTSGLSVDGRLLVPLAPRDSWFNPPAVLDIASGLITRIPSESQGDYRSMGWTRNGQVIALKNGLRATLWKFRPTAR